MRERPGREEREGVREGLERGKERDRGEEERIGSVEEEKRGVEERVRGDGTRETERGGSWEGRRGRREGESDL